MNRKFAISDIHGQFDAMKALLERATFDPAQDTLFVVGDLIDRGPHSGKVVRFIKALQDKHPENIQVVIGNHEIMMREYVFEGKSHRWLRFGGQECIADFNTAFASEDERDGHLVWLANLPLYAADADYFYTHAGVDPLYVLAEQMDHEVTFMSVKELYYFTREEWFPHIGKKKIVHGHTPYHCVYDTGEHISCDLGASVFAEGKLALVDLTNNAYYAYDLTQGDITYQTIHPLSAKERFNK